MTVKIAKSKRNGAPAQKLTRQQAERLLEFIESDSTVPPIASELLALRRERERKGQPDLTVEQIFEELDRRTK